MDASVSFSNCFARSHSHYTHVDRSNCFSARRAIGPSSLLGANAWGANASSAFLGEMVGVHAEVCLA